MLSLSSLNKVALSTYVHAQVHVPTILEQNSRSGRVASVLTHTLIHISSLRQDACTDFVGNVSTAITNVTNVLVAIGVAIGVIGIVVGGLMRATSFGNERRIAASNAAITAAVIGVVIVLVGVSAGKALPGLVGSGNTEGSCNA